MYHFAYGSNMDEEELTTYIQSEGGDPSAVSNPRWARLDDWRLVFNYFSPGRRAGAANIEPAQGQYVEGVLWNATEEALDAIDRREGRPQRYERILVCVSDEKGRLFRDVVAYEVVQEQKRRDFCAPRRDYLDLMKRAASRFGFSEKYRRMLNAIETVERESRGG
jgi:hypothetical protein